MQPSDPIVEEIHKIRELRAARFGFNVVVPDKLDSHWIFGGATVVRWR